MISNPVYVWLGGTIKVIYVYDISCVLQNMQVMASLQIIESEGEGRSVAKTVGWHRGCGRVH